MRTRSQNEVVLSWKWIVEPRPRQPCIEMHGNINPVNPSSLASCEPLDSPVMNISFLMQTIQAGQSTDIDLSTYPL